MKRRIPITCLALCALACMWAGCAMQKSATIQTLDKSPRHHEWAEVASDGRKVHTFVAYPEADHKTPAIVIIHENQGLTDWVRGFADQLAAAGYLAVAPDLLSGFDATHARTSDFPSTDAATAAIYQLKDDRVTHDLTAVRKYAASLPSCNGKIAVIGFCWGGGQSFRFATDAPGLSAALVFYGTAPTDEESIRRITAPVYGFYGGADERIDATIPAAEKAMKANAKPYEPVVYAGAGHAFMRLGEDPKGTPENRKGREDAWVRLKAILGKLP